MNNAEYMNRFWSDQGAQAGMYEVVGYRFFVTSAGISSDVNSKELVSIFVTKDGKPFYTGWIGAAPGHDAISLDSVEACIIMMTTGPDDVEEETYESFSRGFASDVNLKAWFNYHPDLMELQSWADDFENGNLNAEYLESL